ncbi:DUF4012 domain-containing protein [Candidatus Microgenomates bacterium]|nr:DUF4012 domain-containing protein [Candidatus Microgenomates bacterium]
MDKQSPKMVTTSLEGPPKVLIIGQKNRLTTKLLKALEKKDCQVFFRKKVPIQIDYIFQFNHFSKTKNILDKAAEDNSRHLLIEEKETILDEEMVIAEEELFNFKTKIDCRILRIERTNFSNLDLVVNQIMKAMFARKKPWSSLIKPSIKKKKLKLRKKHRLLSLPKLQILFFALCFLFFVLSPYFFFGINFFLGIKKLAAFEKSFLTGNLVKAQSNTDAAQTFLNRAEKTADFLPFFKTSKRMAFFGRTLSQIGDSSIKITIIGQKTARLILGEEKGEVKQRLDQLKVEVESLERQLFLTKALYQDLGFENFQNIRLFSLGEKFENISNLLSSGKEGCLLIKKALPLIDEIIEGGFYLVLFQNNMELRPGGGFIGSYGLANFKEGRLIKFETHDVYSADGQLKGHVEPPAAIRKYLDQPHFFLRDSNFWPDFAANAQKAAWFYKKEIGDEVDGVIAVDLSFVQKILEVLGKVYLPDYKQEITAGNIFLKTQTLVQGEFFPGSTQKRDFLGALARAILNQAKIGEFPWLKTGKSLKQSLEEKHIQIYLVDQKGQELVEKLGWGGRITNVKCQSSNVKCFADYLMIVEANFGVNKANYFVKREISLETEFNQKEINHQLSIAYQNKSPGKTFPGGIYKNYLRLFVPQESVLERIKFKGKEVPVKEIEIETDEGRQSWGILVEINPAETGKVEFHYGLVIEEAGLAYELFFQKQAGTDKDPLFLKFNYPASWQIKKTNFPAVVKNASFNYNTNLSVDRIFSIDF